MIKLVVPLLIRREGWKCCVCIHPLRTHRQVLLCELINMTCRVGNVLQSQSRLSRRHVIIEQVSGRVSVYILVMNEYYRNDYHLAHDLYGYRVWSSQTGIHHIYA